MAEQFPIPEEKLALIDLDGTLLGANYQVTTPVIYETIEAAQTSGWTIGMSSDTPHEAMKLWHQRFGMNGPIIAEKGAVVDCCGRLQYNAADSEQYSKACTSLSDYFRSQGLVVWEGNPVEALRQGIKIGKPGETAVLLSNQRLASIGLFIREVDEAGDLIINNELSESLVEAARDFYPDFDDIAEDFNRNHGLVIVSRTETTKRQGTLLLAQAIDMGRIAMIGNSLADYVGQDIAMHYAVNDSTPEFKEKADYIARAELTAGVDEILQAFSLAAVDQKALRSLRH